MCWFACVVALMITIIFFFKQKTAYEMRISDWSSDVCSSDLIGRVWNITSADAAHQFAYPNSQGMTFRSIGTPISLGVDTASTSGTGKASLPETETRNAGLDCARSLWRAGRCGFIQAARRSGAAEVALSPLGSSSTDLHE